ncbi:MAG: transcriptional regulator, LysR family [Anaerolineae bacterium]|jgi:DNA-binding transcriptional LysR family regulator|nr:MAG: transcriptional regulator, LysR family [Anaerolineae bacterium]
MLDIHQLHIFLTAAETLSFTRTAQRLHMTQPSVSQHIQSLERYFGCELFVRNGRNLELTDAGLKLAALAQEAVMLSARIESEMASLQKGVVGHLLIGCCTTPGKYILPKLLTSFHDRYPRVRVTCSVLHQRDALKLLLEGKLHFTLTSLIENITPELESVRFICDRLILIAPVHHPWAESGEITPDQLVQGRFILREEGSGSYEAIRKALNEVDISIHDLPTVLTLGNSEAIALTVREGLGVGFVSEKVVEAFGLEGLAIVQIKGLEIERDIYISRNKRQPSTIPQTTFWSYLYSPDNPFCLCERTKDLAVDRGVYERN